ncbi:PRC-barrel domain-containing protein [Xanthobacteraceae bacterium Astr-EGSB]|uniref:PRC-barrel domain-containing protein n=1 Tax=Astrobacterium formosum TaxID=3069710 RepID=UPI0027B70B59|nr:PRC-barrel domain-containing protein [Xanthobacteraceae bacterium Astr-EGSB]
MTLDIRFRPTAALSMATLLTLCGPVLAASGAQGPKLAQNQPAQNGTGTTGVGDTQASQCRNDLLAVSRRMDKDGYWLTGWGSRWGYGVAPADRRLPATAARPSVDARAPGVSAAPWGRSQYGISAPRYQIRTLHSAAGVLAARGDEQGCQAVLSELRQVYDAYVADLRRMGVEPGEVANWRQERIAAAKPVEQLGRGPLSVSDVTGTDVRSTKDRNLGTVSDVVIDPQTGTIRYAILERGGFLNFGEHYIAVPWKALQATPGLSLFVLDVGEQTLDDAPRVDPDSFGDPSTFSQTRQTVDAFWQKHIAG